MAAAPCSRQFELTSANDRGVTAGIPSLTGAGDPVAPRAFVALCQHIPGDFLMRSTHTSLGLLAALVVSVGACSRDAQTEDAVQTKTSGGDASTSISGDAADARGQALVRIVNTVPDMNGLIVRSDDAHMLPSVDYKQVSEYQAIDNNWVTFEVGAAATGAYAPVEANRELLTDGHRYTMIVMRKDDGVGYQSRIVRDEISDDRTKAHLRVIHAAPNVDEITVVAKGADELFNGINFTSEAGFKDIDPWSGTLEFRTEDGKRLLGSMSSVSLRPGVSYTIVLTNGKANKLESFWFEDQQVAGN